MALSIRIVAFLYSNVAWGNAGGSGMSRAILKHCVFDSGNPKDSLRRDYGSYK